MNLLLSMKIKNYDASHLHFLRQIQSELAALLAKTKLQEQYVEMTPSRALG